MSGVRNCVDEQVLNIMKSSYVCRPNHSYADSMFRLHSDLTGACVVAGMLHCVRSELPHEGNTL